MEVILMERVAKLGEMGDLVKVKPGFARNYLLPRNKAMRATKENRETFESRRAELEAANAARRQEAEGQASGVANAVVVLVRQASDSGQLYGSVRPRDIADALIAQGADVSREQVRLESPIKNIGMHKVNVALHPEVIVQVTANVARSAEEAELQAQGKSVIEDSREAERAADEENRTAIAQAAAEAEAEEEAQQEADGAPEEK